LKNTRFEDLNIKAPFLKALTDEGYTAPTPIQSETIPFVLQGLDVMGMAQTGTGKTAAFTLPILQKLNANQSIEKARDPRALILAPTRELAIQINDSIRNYGKYIALKHTVIFGGVKQGPQVKLLGKGMDIIVATPGRLLDLINQGFCSLNKIECFVLDEADRMLDMGFIPDVKKIERATPQKDKRQTLFFSATFPDAIKRFAQSWTNDAVTVEIEPENVAADLVTQINYIVEADDKFKLLYNILEKDNATKILLFCNRKDTAKDLFEKMQQYEISATLLSGDIDQRKRMNRLENFKKGKFKVLVATDVAGRGIHIDAVSHVINYNLPVDPEDYIHRIGRTGRAGEAGISISFACEDDSFNIPNIEEFMKRKLDLVYPDDILLQELPPPKKTLKEVKDSSKPSEVKNKNNTRNNSRNKTGGDNRRPSKPRQPRSKPNTTKPSDSKE